MTVPVNKPPILRDADDDPARRMYPPTLPVELALGFASPRKICEAYDLTRADFEELIANPVFVEDLRRARDLVRQEGMSFRIRAQLQSEALLETSWAMIHNPAVPPSVRADLLKFTVRVAGLDASKDQAANAPPGPTLNIQINM